MASRPAARLPPNSYSGLLGAVWPLDTLLPLLPPGTLCKRWCWSCATLPA